jgi:hypothetical protein
VNGRANKKRNLTLVVLSVTVSMAALLVCQFVFDRLLNGIVNINSGDGLTVPIVAGVRRRIILAAKSEDSR